MEPFNCLKKMSVRSSRGFYHFLMLSFLQDCLSAASALAPYLDTASPVAIN